MAKDTDQIASRACGLKSGDMIHVSNQGVQMTAIAEKVKFKTQEELKEEAKVEEEKRVAAGTNLRDARG
jgi:hypothetical protein